jgi:hypothetical protein
MLLSRAANGQSKVSRDVTPSGGKRDVLTGGPLQIEDNPFRFKVRVGIAGDHADLRWYCSQKTY